MMNWARWSGSQRSPSRSSWTSILLALCLCATFPTQHYPYAIAQSFTPTVVSGPAYARTITKLYVVGGARSIVPDVRISQFMYLDLLVPFTSTAPAWTQLADGP